MQVMKSSLAAAIGFAGGTFSTVISFRFSAKYTDVESGLVYYGFRYYQPSTGRWLSRDPIEEDGGVNLHAFVKNSPVDENDPLGMCIWTRRWDLPATPEKCRTVDTLVNRRAVGFNQTLWDHWKAGSGNALTTNIEKYDALGMVRYRHTLLAHKQGWENGLSVAPSGEGMTTYLVRDEQHTSYLILPMSYGHRWNVTCTVNYKRPCEGDRFNNVRFVSSGVWTKDAVLISSSCEFKTTDRVDFWNRAI